jgi:glucose-1-phosphate cytidylyltransferase
MKVVILAGGFGTRLSEETMLKPKPMVTIGGKPILWHIMKSYSQFGYNDFVICLGYLGYVIKEYFANYYLHQSDISIDLSNNSINTIKSKAEDWKITLIDTGHSTLTGGRIKRIQEYIGNETFLLTYGDGIGNVDIDKLVEFHRKNNRFATVTAVQPTGRFGLMNINKVDEVTSFNEKPIGDNAWVNGGFFVLEPQVFDYISGDNIMWEKEPLERLTQDNQLIAFKHSGFWKPMDTLRDKNDLENCWDNNNLKWRFK